MTIPCTQESNIIEIGNTVKKIHSVVTDLALQNQRIGTLETTSVDHEKRIRRFERTPVKLLCWGMGIVGTITAAWATHMLWG